MKKKKKKAIKPRPSTGPKCECSGTLKPVTLRNFDFSRYSGLPSVLDGAPGWRCGSCQREMLHGKVINASLFLIAMDIDGEACDLWRCTGDDRVHQGRAAKRHQRFCRAHARRRAAGKDNPVDVQGLPFRAWNAATAAL